MTKLSRLLALFSLVTFASACQPPDPSATDDTAVAEDDGKDDGVAARAAITWKRVSTRKAIPISKPASGTYRMHMIDVGTGLAMLIQGADFTMLYDGGSGDDHAGITASSNGNRLLAYLFASLGPSGGAECTPDGDGWEKMDRPMAKIDHLFLSHPHLDHDSLLADVVHCYAVKEVWDSGDDNNRTAYGDFLQAVVATDGVVYHNAAGRSGGDQLTVGSQAITLPADVRPMAMNDELTLGRNAKLTLLHVNGEQTQDENLNSTVVRLQLGRTRILLAGDAEGGGRADPSSPASAIEGDLVAQQAHQLGVDILQVAHHGSSTSSRQAFLDLVQPKIALIGAGPFPYSGVRLPDQNVIDAIMQLPSKPVLLRTDAHDATITTCATDRIGNDDDAPGGCDNYLLTIKR